METSPKHRVNLSWNKTSMWETYLTIHQCTGNDTLYSLDCIYWNIAKCRFLRGKAQHVRSAVYRSYSRVANHVRVTLGEKQGRQIPFFFLRSIFKQQEILNSKHQERHWMPLNLLNRDFRRVLFPVRFHYCGFYSDTAACVSSAQFSPLCLYNNQYYRVLSVVLY